jgi:diaminopimelate epimerase
MDDVRSLRSIVHRRSSIVFPARQLMPLHFIKVEAGGNDFVLVDARREPVRDAPALAIRLCDRHRGVGGDGLLTLEGGRSGPPLLRMFNPDGTEDFCGNGLRCAAAFLVGPDADGESRPVLLTPRGRHEARVSPLGRGAFEVEIDLLVPQFDPAEIPVRLPGKAVLRHPIEIAGRPFDQAQGGPEQLSKGRTFPISCVSTGTAHTAIFMEADIAERVFQEISPLLERHALFPERTSVLWCRAEGRERIHMRIWERGVGETFSCGSGVAAATAIGRTLGLTGDRVEVIMRGGRMTGEWRGEGPVRIAGPARIVYTGEIRDEETKP